MPKNSRRILCALLVLAACTDDGGSRNGQGDEPRDTGGAAPDADTDVDTDADADADADADTDADVVIVDTETDPGICDELEITFDPQPVQLMILQDRSSSMQELIDGETKWEIASAAVSRVVTAYEQHIDFGIDFFSMNGIYPDAVDCTVSTEAVVDTLPGNSQYVQDLMTAYGTDTSTPLYLAMQNYNNNPAHAPVFFNGERESYLLIISDGQDSCGNDGGDRWGVTPTLLSDLTTELVSNYDMGVVVIGFGDGVDANQLNAIAEAGGMPFDTYFDAQDADALTEALDQIAETVMAKCSFEVGDLAEGVNLELTNIFFDGNPVPRDDGCSQNGYAWTWTDEERTAFEFCQEACAALEANQVTNLKVEIACSINDVHVI